MSVRVVAPRMIESAVGLSSVSYRATSRALTRATAFVRVRSATRSFTRSSDS